LREKPQHSLIANRPLQHLHPFRRVEAKVSPDWLRTLARVAFCGRFCRFTLGRCEPGSEHGAIPLAKADCRVSAFENDAHSNSTFSGLPSF
jgi:hypothetical protein